MSKNGVTYMGNRSGNHYSVYVFPAEFNLAAEIAVAGFLVFAVFLGLTMCIHGWPW